MIDKLSEIKALIRGILLALGRRTTEKEFRKEYFQNEQESFAIVLRNFNMGFLEFLKAMPDVCRAYMSGDEVIIERVSTEETSHMDHLTIAKKRKRNPPNPRFSQVIRRPYSQFGNRNSHQKNTPYFSRPHVNSTAKRIEKFHPAPSYTMKRTENKYGTDQNNNKENFKPSKPSANNYNRADISSLPPRLPPPPHLLMRTVVYKGCSSNASSNDNKSLNKDNVLPIGANVRTDHINNKENSKSSNISKPSSAKNYNRADVTSLPPTPHLLMPTVVYKGCSSNASSNDNKSLNKDNVLPIGANVRTDHINNKENSKSSNISKPSSAKNYSRADVTSLPPTPHLLMPTIVYKGCGLNDNKSLNKDTALPTGAKVSTDQKNNNENSMTSKISKSSAKDYNRADLTSLPPSPYLLMPTIVYKGCGLNGAKNLNKGNVPSSSDITNVASAEKKDVDVYKISSDSSNWTSFNDDVQPPKRTIKLSPNNPFKNELCSNKSEPRSNKVKSQTSTNESNIFTKLENLLTGQCLRKYRNYITEPNSIPPPQIIPFGYKGRMNFDVKIQVLHSPSHFVFQFNIKDLDSLMDEMNTHYNNLEDSAAFKIPDIRFLSPGMTVAAYDNGKWYRAEVINLTESDVLVLLLDYSKRKYLKPQNLRYLENSFAKPSRKSAKGRLFGVKPNTSENLWNIGSIMGFNEQTENVKLTASLKNFKNGIYELSLIDENCQSIKDFMVEKGFAQDDKTDSSFNAFLY